MLLEWADADCGFVEGWVSGGMDTLWTVLNTRASAVLNNHVYLQFHPHFNWSAIDNNAFVFERRSSLMSNHVEYYIKVNTTFTTGVGEIGKLLFFAKNISILDFNWR